ncbi:hypothetical protein [Trichormus sp. NMC-1]|nr:hypothetical protein [Trichormus sp. NMC-1]
MPISMVKLLTAGCRGRWGDGGTRGRGDTETRRRGEVGTRGN